MSQLTAFVGVTGLVLTGFLVLARLSQRVVEEADPDGSDTPHRLDRREGPSVGSTDARDSDVGSSADVTDPAESARSAPPKDPSNDESIGSSTTESASPSSVPSDAPGHGEAWDLGAMPEAEHDRSQDEATAEHAATGAPEETVPGIESMSAGALLANVALTQGLFGGLLAAAAWYFEVPASALGLWGGPVEGVFAVVVGVGFGLALWVGNEVASALADAAGAAYDEELRSLLAPETTAGWIVLLGGTLPIIALVEEFLFRAAAIGAAATAFPVSPWALAVVSSAAFALGHGAQGRVGVVVTGALGFALAAGFVLSGSLVVVVVAHYLVNALEFGLHEGLGLPDPVWS